MNYEIDWPKDNFFFFFFLFITKFCKCFVNMPFLRVILSILQYTMMFYFVVWTRYLYSKLYTVD